MVNYLAVVELFPPLARGTCAGICNTSGRVFTIFAPMVAEMNQPLPSYIFLCAVTLAGLGATCIKVRKEETSIMKKLA
jgi:hypothetical protein